MVCSRAFRKHDNRPRFLIIGSGEGDKETMKRSSAATLTLVILLSLSATMACGGKKVEMTPASTQPAASGVAHLDHDKNGNLNVDLRVKHLAHPQNLSPPKSTYIVWIQPKDSSSPQKLGELRVNDNLEGQFKAPVPVSNFQIFVTAEDGPTVSQPSGPEVLRQTVGMGG
jgi:hypothetical protein